MIYHIKRKFAWLPKYVNTWRPKRTKAIIWLQDYWEVYNREGTTILERYVNHLGFWSYEYHIKYKKKK